MVGGGYMVNDLDDNAMAYGDVFEDLLDFSNDGMQLLMEPEPLSFDDGLAAADSAFPPLAEAPSVGAPGATVGIKSDDTTFPCDDLDVAELEWLSNFVEESFSAASMELPQSDNNNMTIKNNNDNMMINISNNNNDGVEASGDDNKFELHCRTPSPVSVLEHNGLIIGGGNGGSFLSSSSSPVSSSPTSSSCSSVGGGVKVLVPFNQPETTAAVRGRAPRTKRARPPSGPRSNVLLPIVASSTEGTHGGDSLLMIPSVTNYSEVENLGAPKSNTPESQADQVPPLVDSNNKKKKLKIVSSAASIAGEVENSQALVRKCLHCEIQKTPQWRAGPMGPKTLCNACGVRYKSGRLFPEYRPAASPTFVSSLHSNSHKKVVEMRVRAASKKDSSAVAPSLPASAKGCELLNYIRSN